LKDVLDVGEGVAEDVIAAVLVMLPLPVVAELAVALQHREQAEVHRAHVEAAHLRACPERRGETVGKAHAPAAACGDVHHRVCRLLDSRQERHEHRWVSGRAAVLRVARMQVEDGRSGFGRGDRFAGDFVRRHRQVGRHRRRMDRARHRAGDDGLALPRLRHAVSFRSATAG